MEIRYYQKGSGLLLPRSSFAKLVRELLHDRDCSVQHFQSNALLALQEAAEAYLAAYFESKSNESLSRHLECTILMLGRHQPGGNPRQASNHSSEGHAACPSDSRFKPGRGNGVVGWDPWKALGLLLLVICYICSIVNSKLALISVILNASQQIRVKSTANRYRKSLPLLQPIVSNFLFIELLPFLTYHAYLNHLRGVNKLRSYLEQGIAIVHNSKLVAIQHSMMARLYGDIT